MRIFTDGGSRGNPGHAATGVVVLDGETILFESGVYLGIATNNVAEYEAVLRALSWVAKEKELGHFPTPQTLEFRLDSQLVVEQLNGRYKIKQPHILAYVKKIQDVLTSLGYPVTFTHIPRSENARADALVNQALDSFLHSF
ncbi:MAG: ribonuclease HI family protein [Candidatus Pacebacteria bacterium]|nr:ribonuclease HI family protein [Candidatus Paceibacterota bacterium]